ncbi:MAG: threonine ammonia-lyase [Nocardioidaceae bacterium]
MKNISRVSLEDVEEAAARVAGTIIRTPLLRTELGSPTRPLHLKAESLQLGGSFKLRGATNAVLQLSPEERARGVITHSSGNHAQALARAANAAGVRATIVMPRQSPQVKQAATRAHGAEIVLVDIAERESAVAALQAETGAVLVPPYDDVRIIAGQGTVGLEVLADLTEAATVLVPVSGGGLISGIAVAVKALRPRTRIVGVEPELAADLAEGFVRRERVVWDAARTGRTIADGLRVVGVGELNWLHIQDLVDEVITVTEDEILASMRRIVMEARLVCEPSGAVATAGFMAAVDQLPTGPTVAIVSGGNVDPDLLAKVVQG